MICAAAVLILVLGNAGMISAGEEKSCADGQEKFMAAKCNMCHAVEAAGIEAKVKSEKMAGPDLTGFASRQEEDWFVQYVKKEVQLEGKDHKGTFKGSDEDLKAMYAWLGELSAE
jgi:hypothetical protein